MDLDDPYHRAHVEAIFSAHPHGKNAEAFYAIQVLWDESMAQSAFEFLHSDKGKDKQLIIFAGTQHVEYGYGIPKRLFRRLPEPYTIIIPNTLTTSTAHIPKTMDVTIPEIPLSPAHYIWTVEHRELKKQKVTLGVRIDKTSDGVKIFGIVEGSVAEKAGLEKGDYILRIDDQPVEDVTDITFYILRMKPDEKAVIEIQREDELKKLNVIF